MSQEEYFSNSGSLGTERRQDDRLYMNAETHLDNVNQAEELYNTLQQQADGMQDVSRIVMRGICSQDDFRRFLEGRFGRFVEAAIDLSEHGHEGILMYVSQNLPVRGETLVPVDEMIEQTSSSQIQHLQQPLSSLFSGGNDVVVRNNLQASELPQLFELWGNTFGWSYEELEGFLHQLTPDSQNLWFAGVYAQNGEMISAAMGDRIDLIGKNGPITFVENTEWSTRPNGFRGKGYMSMAVTAIGAQVLSALSNSPNGPAVLYAECNHASRSDRVALNAGYQIPDRTLARQILARHVTVNDGLEPAGLRDFNIVTLPFVNASELYDPETLHQINEGLRNGNLDVRDI